MDEQSSIVIAMQWFFVFVIVVMVASAVVGRFMRGFPHVPTHQEEDDRCADWGEEGRK